MANKTKTLSNVEFRKMVVSHYKSTNLPVVCHYCGSQLSFTAGDFKKRPTVDHVIPLSKGGKNEMENAVLCCLDCNRDKSDHILGEVYKNIPEIREETENHWAGIVSVFLEKHFETDTYKMNTPITYEETHLHDYSACLYLYKDTVKVNLPKKDSKEKEELKDFVQKVLSALPVPKSEITITAAIDKGEPHLVLKRMKKGRLTILGFLRNGRLDFEIR